MPLFRVSGIPVGVDWTWLLALGYVVYILANDYQSILGAGKETEAFLYAAAVALAFFGSIVLHEFGHAIVARRNGIGILGIDLWLLGGLAKMDRDPQTPGVEFRVAAAGPAVTALVAAVCLGGAFAADSGQASHLVQLRTEPGDDAWMAAITSLGTVNVFLLVFNLIPAFPLDGGRIARSIIWRVTGDPKRSMMIAAQIGRVFGWLLIGFGILMLSRAPLSGVIFIFMGWTISQSARGATMQQTLLGEATALTVADVMDRQPVAMSAEASVQQALDEYFWRYRWPWFPVVDQSGRFLGLIEQNAVERVDEFERANHLVNDLVTPGSATDRAVNEHTPLTAVLAGQQIQDYGALMAVSDDGLLAGVVTIEQIQRALREAIARATRRPEEPASDL